MVLAGRTQMMDTYPVPEALRRMKDLGFDGAEICVEDSEFRIRDELCDAGFLEEVGASLRELEYRLWSYSYHADYVAHDEVLTRTVRAIELTRHLGTDVFVFSGGFHNKLADPETQWKLLVSRTKVLVDAAGANGVRLALEPEPGFYCGTTEALLRLIDEIDSPVLGCNMDIGHAFLCDRDPLGAIKAIGPRTVHAHVENMRRGVHDHRIPPDGDMDLSEYMTALADTGFEGQAALDLYGYDYEAVAADSVSFLRDCLVGT